MPFPGRGRGKSYQSGSYTEPAKGQLPTQRHGRRRWGGTLRGRHNSAATEFYTYQILEETLLNPQTAESQHQTPLAREQTLVICYLLAGWPDTRSWSPHLPNREKRSTKPHREAMKTQLSKLPDAWGGPWRSQLLLLSLAFNSSTVNLKILSPIQHSQSMGDSYQASGRMHLDSSNCFHALPFKEPRSPFSLLFPALPWNLWDGPHPPFLAVHT